uniref:Cytochrome c oxidase subunit 2 n=1 Tax=Carcinoscorpius rotundicauda TaxID=6848 RepID=K7QG84_CARRO|nr:cytochrome c oxidase subunit II [Carcinoscorpius rotundicauda]AFR25736.1 cytochrome c oxidase subunit II [Carcinoscorpius rotundicauda]AFT65388.1 cytochrome c oxidase subunit II [Carcinoscorpius rotundicauda]WDZ67355.1 cytochrome c oxidase subunit II [Carcinoscorpius rotundicauda]
MATWSHILFQDSASPTMEQMIFFHDHTMIILTLITTLVGYMMMNIMYNSFTNRVLLEGQEIETFWTIIPALMLIFIALPSLRLLYLMDEINNPTLTMKTIGHQWYWSYEYSDFTSIEFDSYMIPDQSMNSFSFRLLDVDNRTILPMNTQIRIMITAADVIHAWTIPALGMKIDAIPGRLNQASTMINRPGLFFGQCSEICGANHSFMPIVIESVNTNTFIKWMNSMSQ